MAPTRAVLRIWSLLVLFFAWGTGQAQLPSVQFDFTDGYAFEGNFRGVNMETFFASGKCTPDSGLHWASANRELAYRMGQIRPTVLRFVGGGISDHTHPLPLSSTQGYGISTQGIDSNCHGIYGRMRKHADKESGLPEGCHYLDELIELVEYLGVDKVSVIYVLNIANADPDSEFAAVQYLLERGVHVMGLEFGNEVVGMLSNQDGATPCSALMDSSATACAIGPGPSEWPDAGMGCRRAAFCCFDDYINHLVIEQWMLKYLILKGVYPHLKAGIPMAPLKTSNEFILDDIEGTPQARRYELWNREAHDFLATETWIDAMVYHVSYRRWYKSCGSELYDFYTCMSNPSISSCTTQFKNIFPCLLQDFKHFFQNDLPEALKEMLGYRANSGKEVWITEWNLASCDKTIEFQYVDSVSGTTMERLLPCAQKDTSTTKEQKLLSRMPVWLNTYMDALYTHLWLNQLTAANLSILDHMDAAGDAYPPNIIDVLAKQVLLGRTIGSNCTFNPRAMISEDINDVNPTGKVAIRAGAWPHVLFDEVRQSGSPVNAGQANLVVDGALHYSNLLTFGYKQSAYGDFPCAPWSFQRTSYTLMFANTGPDPIVVDPSGIVVDGIHLTPEHIRMKEVACSTLHSSNGDISFYNVAREAPLCTSGGAWSAGATSSPDHDPYLETLPEDEVVTDALVSIQPYSYGMLQFKACHPGPLISKTKPLVAFEVFPTLASDRVTLRSTAAENTQYTLYSASGAPLAKGQFSGSTSLDISRWAAGMYYVNFTTSTANKAICVVLGAH